jgi:hypothetical protein
MFPLFCLSQTIKGSFFIETGTTLFGGGDYTAFVGKTGISLWSSKTHLKDSYHMSGPSKYQVSSYSVAPRLGWYLSNRLTLGVDFQHFKNNYSNRVYDQRSNYNHLLSGLFLRYYFVNKKHSPFIEFATGTGISKNNEESISSGGANYEVITYYNLPYISGTAGYSFSLNSRFKLGIAATVQNTFEKPNDKGIVINGVEKFSILETGLVASISYRFRISKKD